MEYRVWYPSHADGTLEDDELDSLTFQGQDNEHFHSMLDYLRARGIPFRVEYRQWTPTEWQTIGGGAV